MSENGNHNDKDHVVDEESGIRRTVTGVTIPPELFERVRAILPIENPCHEPHLLFADCTDAI